MERNHIRIGDAGGQEPCEDFLRGLRRLSPDLDAHYMGRGRWIVGHVRPNHERTRLARRAITQLGVGLDKGGPGVSRGTGYAVRMRVHLNLLAMRGFAPVCAFNWPSHDHWPEAVDEYRRRDWVYRTNQRGAFEDRLHEAMVGPGRRGRKQLEDDLEAAIHQEFPFLFRGRKFSLPKRGMH